MKKIGWKQWLCGGTGALMLVLTGCQSVDGLDINKALVKQYEVKSAEATESLKLELITGDTKKLPEDAQRLLDLFKNVTIKFTEEKMESQEKASIKGEFVYGKGSIPFHMSVDKQDVFISIEGVSKPIHIRNAQMNPVAGGMMMPDQEKIEEMTKALQDSMPSLASFFIGHAPNPKTISVTSVTETVYNESVSLKKLHAEIKGSEALGLVKTLLQNIAADEEGLKEFIGTLFDVLAPIVKETVEESGESNVLIDTYLNNKTLTVATIYEFIQNGLKEVLNQYDAETDKFLNSPGQEPLREILSDRSSVKVDLLVDGDQHIRKSTADINIPLPEAETGLKGFKVSSTSERWNINKPVTIDPVKADGDKILFDTSNPEAVPSLGSFLRSIDKNSAFYKLIKEDLQVTKRNALVSMDDEWSKYGFAGYLKNDVSMAPVTYVSELLDAEVKWDGATKQITVIDDLNGHTVVFTLGSDQAVVDGKTVTLEQSAELTGDFTFVPLRFLVESLGGEVKWDGDEQAVRVTRP
ncbi:copper amine oxidase N-terminal domain-containing protein [Paenibacillus lutrae]|uniref:Copper amine oxidase N-terminal domain-containing protein n=1 Tax=Paenibacillus lutrae TaxID=2078573 RepID=A0A7X3FLC3_9BACL|nr:copper amine oxidase N-terminal domain-containing protein [Paenibacillus lutrae]MVP01743.1 copper amine oxidase N-terminal domain-containing protein [Paenibacillus lutrae]